MPTPKKRSLEIWQDLAFERRQWKVQRVGWIVIAIILLLALLGVFGNGPLSHAETSAGALRAEYERFTHADAPTTLHIHVRAPGQGNVRLAINRDYLDAIPIQHIRPAPLRVESAGNDQVYEFAAPDAGDLHVSIDASPQAPSLPTAVVRLQGANAATLGFRQVVYP